MRNFAKLAAAGALSLAIVSGSAFAATNPDAQAKKEAAVQKKQAHKAAKAVKKETKKDAKKAS